MFSRKTYKHCYAGQSFQVVYNDFIFEYLIRLHLILLFN